MEMNENKQATGPTKDAPTEKMTNQQTNKKKNREWP